MNSLSRQVDFASEHRGLVFAAAFAPCGGLAATGDSDGRVVLWSLPGGTVKWCVEAGDARRPASVEQLVFAPGTRRLYAAVTFFRDQHPAMAVRGWDVDTGTEVTPAPMEFAGWGRLAVSSDGARAVLAMFGANSDGSQWVDLAAWRATPLNPTLLAPVAQHGLRSIHRCVAGFDAASAVVRVHFLAQPSDGAAQGQWHRATLDARTGRLTACAPWDARVSARVISTLGPSCALLRYAEQEGSALHAVGLDGTPRSVHWRIVESSLDGEPAVGPSRCVVGTAKGEVRVYENGVCIAATVLPDAPRVLAVALSADERQVLVAAQGGRVSLWSVAASAAAPSPLPVEAGPPGAAQVFVQVSLKAREDGLWFGRLGAPWVSSATAWFFRVAVRAGSDAARPDVVGCSKLASWAGVSAAVALPGAPPVRPTSSPLPGGDQDGAWFAVNTHLDAWQGALADKTVAFFLPPSRAPDDVEVELWAQCAATASPRAVEAYPRPRAPRPTPPQRMGLRVSDFDGVTRFFWPLGAGDNIIGRDVHASFADDTLLSGRHARFLVQDRGVWVQDQASRNGVFVRLPRDVPHPLSDLDHFMLGRVILRFDHRPAAEREGWLQCVVGRDVDSTLFPWPVPLTGATLGREGATLSLPRCREVARLHCELSVHDRRVMLTDRGSARGTFLRIGGVVPLSVGAELVMGQWVYTVCEM